MAGSAQFCPRCGTARTGDLRFCASCAYDFQPKPEPSRSYQIVPPKAEPVSSWSYAPPPAAPIKESRSGLERLLIVGIVIALLVGGYIVWTNARVASIVNDVQKAIPTQRPGQMPPVGAIWFGSSFDTGTMAVRDVGSRFGVNQAFSMVAHLPRAEDGSRLVLRVYLDGQLITTTSANATGSGDVFGWTLGPLFTAGTWRYDVTDIGGNVMDRDDHDLLTMPRRPDPGRGKAPQTVTVRVRTFSPLKGS
jgi:hypothetical protein